MTDPRDDPTHRLDLGRVWAPRSHRGLSAAARQAEIDRDTAAALAALDQVADVRAESVRRLDRWGAAAAEQLAEPDR